MLRKEVAYLKELLRKNGIRVPAATAGKTENKNTCNTADVMPPSEKVRLFRSLFRGREDVFALRWQSKSGKSGYSPACGNEWKPGICGKPLVKCLHCNHRKLLSVTDDIIYKHLAGDHTVGVYPLLTDDTCWWLAIDFDESQWRQDVSGFMESCAEFGIPAYTEISRSGNGAHVWMFFSEAIPAGEARELGTMLISHTCSKTRQLSLSSYDRMFPNQKTLPKGGFGNLIALPLQKSTRQKGFSVFVNSEFVPYADQWKFLKTIRRFNRSKIVKTVEKLGFLGNSLDVAFSGEEASSPWETDSSRSNKINGELPKTIRIVKANQIFVEKKGIPPALMNRIVRIATFSNPEYYKAQAMRLSVWNKPRVICCAENFARHIGLPRGCYEALIDLLKENGIQIDLVDKQNIGIPLKVKFLGRLRQDQEIAAEAIAEFDTGVLSAPTAFGKTVVAADLIARRGVSTIVLVHRTSLLEQWKLSLKTFLDFSDSLPGVYGGGRKKLSGIVDVAVIQSLVNADDLIQLLQPYGQVIIDECHHVSASSFEKVLKAAGARYITGLTATPVRRDGRQAIVFMQCGPIRHRVVSGKVESMHQEVWISIAEYVHLSSDVPVQEVFKSLVDNASRNKLIADDVIAVYREGRKVLVLTERTAHLEALKCLIENEVGKLFILHGRIPKGKRRKIHNALALLDPETPHVILATGRLVGEGFDHPQLNTLVLAMPVSWKGTLQQYAGRLHRRMYAKNDVRIYDYIDVKIPLLARMWKRRERGYTGMGYRIISRELPRAGSFL